MSQSLVTSNKIPPPPPNSSPLRPQSDSSSKIPTIAKRKFDFPECKWAADYPELQRAFYFANVCTVNSPKYCKYYEIEPIIQIGPTCGLTAISMILNGRPTPELLLLCAKEQNFTNNGEMFSAQNLLQILNDNIDKSNIEYDHLKFNAFIYDGNMEDERMKNLIKNEMAIVLFAYDVDANHSPCEKKGHKAHWGVIVGCAMDLLDNFYVIARHGKSKNLAVWPLSAVARSNSNLNEIENCKSEFFVMPCGGIAGQKGLKEKCIVILGLNNAVINVI